MVERTRGPLLCVVCRKPREEHTEAGFCEPALWQSDAKFISPLEEIRGRIERAQEGYGPIQDLADCLELLDEMGVCAS